MPIVVRFPAMLHARAGRQVVVDEPVSDIVSLVAALDRRFPGLAAELADPIFNVAVNDEMLLHAVQNHRLADGDAVEFVPTISGGSPVQAARGANIAVRTSSSENARKA